jgi:hypothetical protein
MPSPTQSSATVRGSPGSTQRVSQRETLPSQDSIMTGQHDGNLAIQADVVAMFLKRLVNCRSVAQLVSLVPAAVQDRTRTILDTIVTAHVKKAMAAHLLADWRDHLAKENYGAIPELKSIRSPSVQVSKLADNGGCITKDFSETLKEAKKLALTRMIAIKAEEVEVLSDMCKEDLNSTQLHAVWKRVANTEGVSKEAHVLLYDPESVLSLVQTAISIGENAANKQMTKKQEKSLAVKKTQVRGTAVMPTDSKSLEEFVKEIAKRQKQSAMDKTKAKKSGKGQRGAGPSQTKNQKNPNRVGKKDRKRKSAKRGTSSKKQQKKR